MKNKLALIICVTILLWFLDQIILIKPSFFYSSLALGTLLIILLTKKLVQNYRRHGWLVWLIAPLLFWFSVTLYITIIASYFWIQVLFLAIAWFMYSFFSNLNKYLADKSPERNKKFDNLVLSGGVVTCMAIGASIYGLTSFISWPISVLLSLFVPIAILLFFQFAPLRKNFWPENRYLLPINILLILELAFALSFLPLNYNLLGFVLAIGYYFLLSVMRLRWQEKLDRKNMKGIVILSIIIVIVLFLSTRWL